MPGRTIILKDDQIRKTINRIAYQIYEEHSDETEVIIAGIHDRGSLLAKDIATILEKISPIKVQLIELKVDKDNPFDIPIECSMPHEDMKNKVVIVVDDVVNSGKTLIYGVKHLLKVKLKSLKTAVLVDRSYRRFPISVNYVGISLATTMKENIEVEFKGKKITAYLE